jgi:hypothetical protein
MELATKKHAGDRAGAGASSGPASRRSVDSDDLGGGAAWDLAVGVTSRGVGAGVGVGVGAWTELLWVVSCRVVCHAVYLSALHAILPSSLRPVPYRAVSAMLCRFDSCTPHTHTRTRTTRSMPTYPYPRSASCLLAAAAAAETADEYDFGDLLSPLGSDDPLHPLARLQAVLASVSSLLLLSLAATPSVCVAAARIVARSSAKPQPGQKCVAVHSVSA